MAELADALVSGSSEAIHVGSSPFICTRKRLRIGYNSESFSTKSAFVGINPLSWMKSLCDEICFTAGYGEADLISSEALAEDFIQTRLDFILQSRISFLPFFQFCAILVPRGDYYGRKQACRFIYGFCGQNIKDDR